MNNIKETINNLGSDSSITMTGEPKGTGKVVFANYCPWQPIETEGKTKEKRLFAVRENGETYTSLGRYGVNGYDKYPLIPVGFRKYKSPTHWMPIQELPEELSK